MDILLAVSKEELDALIAEQISYYRARAHEYELGALDFPGGEELAAALNAFRPDGEVLDLACGPGVWTPFLLEHAESVTAVDASPEMLALASSRVADDPRVRFMTADLFEWRPDRSVAPLLIDLPSYFARTIAG